ncbi:hypothetical protein CC1G_02107 [Coprinopsis cinerea okayama7|uniref:Uncharacterized protein n=1 Tax=Coprinopsis cinerea (strain Okayama-7 / 130 / ATCC MYA-4618 / FGSC 9003) TaxID=240176 RepID=A8NK77_COPC7|nr:hypothetical protein CC1G_02107 [Coprinopsis cinerea okayama7\|eukprot:XP_001834371.2 hypothetical protein CC1G_02107 [Coprinopsis cinerea okayama7\
MSSFATITHIEHAKPAKKSLHLLQYGSTHVSTRRTEPRFGTWTLVIRERGSPFAVVFHVEATVCTKLGGTTVDQPPRYHYKMKAKTLKLSKKRIIDANGNLRMMMDPEAFQLAPHLTPIRSFRLTSFEEEQTAGIWEVLPKALEDAVHVNTEPEWTVSQRWVEHALRRLRDAGFDVPAVERSVLNRALEKFNVVGGDDNYLLNFLNNEYR